MVPIYSAGEKLTLGSQEKGPSLCLLWIEIQLGQRVYPEIILVSRWPIHLTLENQSTTTVKT